jgi:hypothetical protein
MSVEASKWAWDQRGVSVSQKLVLLCLADHADDLGENCWPGQKRIAMKTGMSVETVSRVLKFLETVPAVDKSGPMRGILKIIKIPIPDMGPISRNNYKLLLERLTYDQAHPSSRGGGDPSNRGVRLTYDQALLDLRSSVTLDVRSNKPSEDLLTTREPPEGEPAAEVSDRHSSGGVLQTPPVDKCIVEIAGEKYGWPSAAALVALYNHEAADELPAVEIVSPERIAKATEYLKKLPEFEFWRSVMAETKRSQLLRGLKPSPDHEHFQGDFDWLLSKGKGTKVENCVRVFEGRYRDNGEKT